ncbi:coiled-coil domain-containing protein [Marilutibacter alkalisoli]|uniref:Tetratricopeptide repeat protein n=1 Tax=Marilutibacter alkalisoli TaxID=2591633 RepID=A0A514BTT5_9GAMM|nr:hypothetical protein [Lysobacter alkalisoli]QDH70818.1 hypothetical protein FKV23_12555 [Lysobacter alkalisoli]
MKHCVDGRPAHYAGIAMERNRVDPPEQRPDSGMPRRPLVSRVRTVRPHWPRTGWGWWGMLAGLGLVLIALHLVRQPLADRLWPETRAQQLRADAERALAEGRLTADDGSGARELYEAALALEPDRLEAHAGLARVGQAALEQAREAMEDGRYHEAHQLLGLARQLSVPRAESDALATELREREASRAGLDQMLVSAASALKAGHLTGDKTAALPLYQRVLALQPSRTEALEGREDAISALLQQAWQAIRDDELARAGRIIHAARGYDSGHAELPDAMAELARLVERHHARARTALQRGQLTRARTLWREVLAVNAEDADARRGLREVARAQAGQAVREAQDFRFEAAEATLAEARDTVADAPDARSAIAEAERRIAQARESRQRLLATEAGSMPAAELERRLTRLLRDARAAEARGHLLTPPGESAFDRIAAARALAPGDARVAEATARLLPASRECYREALRDNRLVAAGRCLQASVELGGDPDALRESRQRLARRWIEVGDERLGAGELVAARTALESARALDPSAVGLDDFARRVAAATGAD